MAYSMLRAGHSLSSHFRQVNPALIAAFAFVVIQVTIGLTYKIAQKEDGKYGFSQSAAISIAEFCKLCLSAGFFFVQCKQRKREQLHAVLEDGAYSSCGRESMDSGLGIDKSDEAESEPDNDDHQGRTSRSNAPHHLMVQDLQYDGRCEPRWWHLAQTNSTKLSIKEFLGLIGAEINGHTAFGMAHLALLYVIINNSIFVLYLLADPGTITLVRSGITVITALLLLGLVGQQITKGQWLAMILQLCGIVVSQYKPTSGGFFYPFSTYLLIMFQTTVAGSAGVYNQMLLKAEPGSLHVCNMALYSAGLLCNLTIHLISRATRPSEPQFFQGFDSWASIMVILSNVFIGLAITMVYKYADALVKCFASSVSTGILLYLAPLIFGVPLSFLVIPGSITVFVATYIYVDSTAPKSQAPERLERAPVDGQDTRRFPGAYRKLYDLSPYGKMRHHGLTLSVILTLATCLGLVIAATPGPPSKSRTNEERVVSSLLHNTIAHIRVKDTSAQSIGLIDQYRPFFGKVHVSEAGPATGLDDDNDGLDRTYMAVAQNMRDILSSSEQSAFASLLYLHTSTWLDPMSFHSQPVSKVWLSDLPRLPFERITDPSAYPSDSLFTVHHADSSVKAALFNISSQLPPPLASRINSSEFCAGWSGIYNIPRAYWKHFIYMAQIMNDQGVHRDVAVPTMLNIIDMTRRSDPTHRHEILTRLSDCWEPEADGDQPTTRDMLWHRCGRGVDWDKGGQPVAEFTERLRAEAGRLGRPVQAGGGWDVASSGAESIFDIGMPDPVAGKSGAGDGGSGLGGHEEVKNDRHVK